MQQHRGIDIVRAEMSTTQGAKLLKDAADFHETHCAVNRKAGLDPLPWDHLSPTSIRAWVAVAKLAEDRLREAVRS